MVCSLRVHWTGICTLILFRLNYVPFTEQELGILISLFYIIVFICEGIQTGKNFLGEVTKAYMDGRVKFDSVDEEI